MSASSAHDSASTGQKSNSAVSPETASEVRPKDRSSAIRRFVMGCFYVSFCRSPTDHLGPSILTIFVLFSARISSYSFSTFARAASSDASASFSSPVNAMMRSLSSPNRLTSLSRHSCADRSSPVRRQDRRRFSYVSHSSVLSGAENIDANADEEMMLGEVWRMCGARCDSSRA